MNESDEHPLPKGQYVVKENYEFYRENPDTHTVSLLEVPKGTIITIKDNDVGVHETSTSIGSFGNPPDEIRLQILLGDHNSLKLMAGGRRKRKQRKTRKQRNRKQKSNRKSRRARN